VNCGLRTTASARLAASSRRTLSTRPASICPVAEIIMAVDQVDDLGCGNFVETMRWGYCPVSVNRPRSGLRDLG